MGTSDNPPAPPTSFSKSFTTRIFSDVAGDITIVVDGEPFLLHKFPLVARCGKIRKLVAAEMRDSSRALSHTDLSDFPGGSNTFELAMKFCYGINFEITASNMTEDHKEDNLISRTEAYLDQVVFRSLEKSVEVLCSCELLLHPHDVAEASHVPERCVEAIAMNACREQLVLGLSRLNRTSRRGDSDSPEWWIQDLSALRIDYYARVVSAMARTGLRSESIIASLMHYSQESLKGIRNRQERTKLDSGTIENEQRNVVEAIVSLFPNDRVPLSFLFGMLRVGVTIDVSVSCRLELEMRIAQQLERVSLDDLLIPVVQNGESMYDVDTVHRILVCFLKRIESEERDEDECYYRNETETEIGSSTCHTSLLKVGLIIDAYLAEIAPDPFLSLNKFTALIEILPDYVRVTHDGLYRAIDMFLKVTSLEYLCCIFQESRIDVFCDQCLGASVADRTRMQKSLQVRRHKETYTRSMQPRGSERPVTGADGCSSSLLGTAASEEHCVRRVREEGGMMLSSQKLSSGVPSGATSPRDTYASLRRENRELKLEISKVRVRLSELEKEQVLMKQGMMEKSGHGVTLLTSLSKGIGRMSLFGGGAREEKRRKANRKTRSRLKGKTGNIRTESMF
ncbi:hypothetical protein Bca52824_032693 [Brassica carinata]|uniref:Phototropic-responsive NPH3 family protein n=1 Tax=Brassica carinata TaxID=52824 RepID=A0A8X7SCZ1_BRACI|nr:hypothetical protein Bca52824_032693 [Brassica carinata]